MRAKLEQRTAVSGKGWYTFGLGFIVLAIGIGWIWSKRGKASENQVSVTHKQVLGSRQPSGLPAKERNGGLLLLNHTNQPALTTQQPSFPHRTDGVTTSSERQAVGGAGTGLSSAGTDQVGTCLGAARRVFEAQLALARHGISPGSLDGMMGSQTRAALNAYYRSLGRKIGVESNAITDLQLSLSEPALVDYVVTSNDLARLLPLGKTWLSKSQQERLDYETVLELVAEKSQAHPGLIRRLNPEIDWEGVPAGTTVRIPNVGFPPVNQKAAFIQIFLAARALEAFDENTNLLAHFPCSIAQRLEKRPVGELHIAVLASNPNYTFDPEIFPESAEARELGRKLVLQPGPNNPVGTVWMGLDRPGYGIHGTPRPEDVGRTESHGCFRLANWNAEYLFKLVRLGTIVLVEP